MNSLRASVQVALLSVYKTANRFGLLDGPVAETVFRRGYFAYKHFVEDPFARLVKRHPELFRGGDVIDVGANIGYTAMLFARAIDPPYRVHAFEPEQRNFRWLGHTVERAKLGGRVIAHRAAVGAREGTIDLWYNAAHHADHRIATDQLSSSVTGPLQRVPITTIDAHVMQSATPIAFVKIDVQGFEPEVLRGMRETIARNPGLHVAVELSPAALADLGFSADDFIRELTTLLPHTSILERDGHLHSARADAILAQAGHGTLGYVDLVCAREPPAPSAGAR